MAPSAKTPNVAKAPKASKAPKAAAAAATDDDSPQKILATFAPYLDQSLFDTLRFSRDAVLKEIKSTTPIYADWALHVFKALYPPSGSGTSNASADTDADANGTKTREHPLNAILEWESLLQDYRTAAAAASPSTAADDAAKPDMNTLAPQKGGKKGGKNNAKKPSPKPSTPSGSTSNLPAAAAASATDSSINLTAFPSGAALLKHLLDQWIAQPSRIVGSPVIDHCDLSTILSDVCATLQYMSEAQVNAALAADADAGAATAPKTAKPARTRDSDAETDEDDDQDDSPFTETIFHTLHHDKSAFTASSSRIVSLLLRDEEIQIIDPDELLRPAQVEQEKDIVNARAAHFNKQWASWLANMQGVAYEFHRHIPDVAMSAENSLVHVRELAAQLPATVLAWGGVGGGAVDESGNKKRRAFDFDAEWTHVVNMYKVKRKSTDRAAIDAVNAKFEFMVNGLVASHKNISTQVVPKLVDTVLQAAEALVAKSNETKFPEMKSDHDFIQGDNEGNAADAPPSSEELHETLAAESQALMDGVRAAVDALTQRLADEQAAVAAEAQGVLAAFAVATENPLTVGHRLDRAAKGEVRKLAVRLVKQIVASVQALAADVTDSILPLAKMHAFVLKWLGLSMLVSEVAEAQVLGKTATKLEKVSVPVLDKRDEVMNLYQDGLEAGIRTLDLSIRNVVLDEMTMLAATQRARDMEKELFDDGPKAGGKKKKGKGKAVVNEVEAKPVLSALASASVSAAESKQAPKPAKPSAPAPSSAPVEQPVAATATTATTASKGKKTKTNAKATASAPVSTTPLDQDAAASTDLHSSTSIDGVERSIPKELLAVMSSPVSRRAGSAVSRSSNNSSPVPPSSAVAQPMHAVDPEPKTAADALFASAALTADPEVQFETAVDDGSATPFADSNSRGRTPIPNPAGADAGADGSASDFPQPPTSAPDIDLPSLLQETHDLRAALAAAQSAAQRAESAVAQLMAEHARLSHLRQVDQDTANATIKELRGQVARLTAEVHSLKSARGGSSPMSTTVSPPGTASADRSPPTTAAYRMFGPAPTPAVSAPAPPGMSGGPAGLAASAADPWAVPFATGPTSSSSRTSAAGGLPPGFGAAPIKPPTPGAVGSPTAISSSSLVKSPSGSKLDELNQDSVPAHPIRSALHARGHREHYTRGSHDVADNGHGHHHHQERHGRHHHRKGQGAAAGADGESAATDEAAAGGRKHKWSAQTNQVRCAKCFARGHSSDACTVTCSKCGETGHLARMCTA